LARNMPLSVGQGSIRVRSRGLPRNRGGIGRIGLRRDAKACEGSAWSHTGRCLPTLPRAGRRCAGTGACRSGIILRTMRNLLVAGGADDYCLLKLDHQPSRLACCMATPMAVCAAAPFDIFNTKAPADLPSVPEFARVHGQCLRLPFGLLGIGSVVYVSLRVRRLGQLRWGMLLH